MAKKQKKQEALSVSRLINEVLVAQLSIPFAKLLMIPLSQNILAQNVPTSLFLNLNTMALIMCTINNKPLKVFEGQEGLLVTRNGKAGHTRYLPFGRYTINDHAYILFVKEDAPYAVDLRWLAIQYRTEFLQFASSSDNGTWNMTGFFKQVKIDIPDIEEQKSLVDIYDKLTYVQDVLSNLDFSVSKLFDKQVIVDESV